ncbi:hypothetical protein CISIN_1g038723mg [Citrus sinensis]|uniref:Uncharacterized protein n=1 Tax=Citrus sinensis TaxID=2711 RepID=A0A067DYF2_CITSI|nr:hypothetical protein CISIN_1g038723mg [Citrus sinensis]
MNHYRYSQKTRCGTGTEAIIFLDHLVLCQAHRYVLFNCEEDTPFVKKHLQIIKIANRRAKQIDISHIHSDQFPKWFKAERLKQEGDNIVLKDSKRLA